MLFRSSRHLTKFLGAVAIVAPALYGCGGVGGGGGGDQARAAADQAPVCTTPPDSIIGNALDRFISTRKPEPTRFLIPLGTPENVPDGAQYALNTLQRRSFVWPGPDQQKDAIDIARSKGTFVTLVLFFHGVSDRSDGRKSVEFSGHYVDRVNNGTKIARTAVIFDCQAAEGKKYRAADEPPDTAAAPATPPAEPGKSGGGF